ncbi:MAG: MobA/MobL family protein [Acidobacteriia bacterium]|nr:MobA/MobL family protein [Terriglobia bacterium]
MEWFERNHDVPGGGHARSSGGCYHLSFRSGSRARGSCASAAHDYITRSEEYDDPDRDAAIFVESDHMPEWADDEAREYWDAADVYERANGRLYVSADFALPRDLDTEDQVALAHAFAQELTDRERLPYTLAIHSGQNADGREHNPHAHLMISERQNDGIARTREQWFRRTNRTHPDHGGAPKSRTFHGREWMEHARERWAELTNTMLERNGRPERVDHRSYERQGIDREPGHHYGPAAAHMVARGLDHDRLDEAVTREDRRELVTAIDREVAKVEDSGRGGGRGMTGHDDAEPERQRDRDRGGPDRLDDWHPGR